MTAVIVASVALVLMFSAAIVLRVNIGALAFPVSFIVATSVAGLTTDEILEVFPANLFILLAGITYLFAIAQSNGTVDWIIHVGLRLAKGNIALVPWVFAIAGCVITAAGALPGATTAILAPLALRFAASYGISPFLMGIMLIHGVLAGSMSPISPFGVIVNGAVAESGFPDATLPLFANTMGFNFVVVGGVFLFAGGPALINRMRSGEGSIQAANSPPAREEQETSTSGDSLDPGAPTSLNFHRASTLAGLAALFVLALVFGFDVGFTAFTIGVILTLLSPANEASTIRQMPWAIILLVTGMLTFVGVMEEIGVLEVLSEAIGATASPLITPLVAAFFTSLISMFAADAAILSASVPTVLPALQEAGFTSVAGPLSSLVVTTVLVDSAPTSTLGALLLANVQNRDRNVYFGQILAWAVIMLPVGAVVSWLLFVVSGLY